MRRNTVAGLTPPARWQARPGGDRLCQDEAFQLAGKLAVKRLAIGAVEA